MYIHFQAQPEARRILNDPAEQAGTGGSHCRRGICRDLGILCGNMSDRAGMEESTDSQKEYEEGYDQSVLRFELHRDARIFGFQVLRRRRFWVTILHLSQRAGRSRHCNEQG